MTEKLLSEFLNKQTFDIRKTGNGRWIDQKCTPDEVSFVAECVVAFLRENGDKSFHSPEIWKSDYAVKKVQAFFGKPDPLDDSTLDEYNKFFRQPLKMLSAAGILRERKDGSALLFKVVAPDVLNYLARTDWNAYEFLHLYIEKTLRDSGIWDAFETFFELQTNDSFQEMKDNFKEFCFHHTPIKNVNEARRIFAKVLNPLALYYKKRGTVGGRCSPVTMTFDALRYNRENWRDAGKEKNVSRRDRAKAGKNHRDSYFPGKAMAEVREFNRVFNGGRSEVLGPQSSGVATQMHHIFPRNEFPDISAFVENIIPLTASQHYSLAHPGNKTSVIDKDFQHSCLLTRNDTIKQNVLNHYGPPGFYSFSKFAFVLDTGFATDYFENLPENDFTAIRDGIDAKME